MSERSHPLLPHNQTPLESAIAKASGTNSDVAVIASLWDADRCPVGLLPWLAWALSVDEWDESWAEAAKRAAIKESIGIHRRKGTLWAVKRAISVSGYRARIAEWWQQNPVGAEHTFAIDVEVINRGIDDAELSGVARRIDAVKPVRSHYQLRAFATTETLAHIAALSISGEVTEIYPYSTTELLLSPSRGPTFAIGIQSWMTTEIRPQ